MAGTEELDWADWGLSSSLWRDVKSVTRIVIMEFNSFKLLRYADYVFKVHAQYISTKFPTKLG